MVFKPPRSNSSKHTVLLDSIILIEILFLCRHLLLGVEERAGSEEFLFRDFTATQGAESSLSRHLILGHLVHIASRGIHVILDALRAYEVISKVHSATLTEAVLASSDALVGVWLEAYRTILKH